MIRTKLGQNHTDFLYSVSDIWPNPVTNYLVVSGIRSKLLSGTALVEGHELDVAYHDHRTAFDSVSQMRLVEKSENLLARGKAVALDRKLSTVSNN